MCSQAGVHSCWGQTPPPREYLRGAKLPLLGELLREHEQQASTGGEPMFGTCWSQASPEGPCCKPPRALCPHPGAPAAVLQTVPHFPKCFSLILLSMVCAVRLLEGTLDKCSLCQSGGRGFWLLPNYSGHWK